MRIHERSATTSQRGIRKASPDFDIHGAVLAAVTIMAPVSRLTDEKFPAAGAQCVAAAREIEATLQA